MDRFSIAIGKKPPSTLYEVLDELEKEHRDDEECKKFAEEPEDEAVSSRHHGLGQHIRNGYELWKGDSVLSVHFKSLGIFHADDMSGIIMRSLHRRLNSRDIKLKDQVKFYQDFWEETDRKNKGAPLSGTTYVELPKGKGCITLNFKHIDSRIP